MDLFRNNHNNNGEFVENTSGDVLKSNGRNSQSPNKTSYDSRFQRRSRKPNITSTHSHDEYLQAILRKWNGDPDDLFKLSFWISGIRKICPSDRFRNDMVLTTFAGAVMSILFDDENRKYVLQILSKLDKPKRDQFHKLLATRRCAEVENLASMVNAHIPQEEMDVEFGRTVADVSFDHGQEEFRPPIPPKPNIPQLRSPTSRSDSDGEGLIFQSSKPGISKAPLLKRHGLTPSSSQNGKAKKSKNERRVKRLPIILKKTTPSCTTISESNITLAEGLIEEPDLVDPNQTLLTDQSTLIFVSDLENDTSKSCNEAFFVENATPPASPNFVSPNISAKLPLQDTNVEEEKSHTGVEVKKRKFNISVRPNVFYGTREPPPKLSSPLENGDRNRIFGNIGMTKTSPKDRETAFTFSKRKNNHSSRLSRNLPQNSIRVPEDDKLEAHDSTEDTDNNESLTKVEKENYPKTDEEIHERYPKPPSAPRLTLAMFERIRNALAKPAKEVLVYGFSLKLLQEDLAIINNHREWLIDVNMDFYLELIRERSRQQGYPSVYVFHSFFFTLLCGEGGGGYHAVKETTGQDNIFEFDLIFFPIHLNHHWRLVVVECAKKRLRCYDSMRHSNEYTIREIAKYLNREHRRKFPDLYPKIAKVKAEEINEMNNNADKTEVENDGLKRQQPRYYDDDWDAACVADDSIPQQTNAIDCGIFVLQYAEYLSRGQEFDFNQSHIPYFRKRMIYEILTKTLMTSI